VFEISSAAKTICGRAYRHTATHYAYSCSVDWQGAVDDDPFFAAQLKLQEAIITITLLLINSSGFTYFIKPDRRGKIEL